MGDFQPFFGIGRGSFDLEQEETEPAWSFYSGLEFLPIRHVGLLIEYRATRTTSGRGNHYWNKEVGVGLALRYR